VDEVFEVADREWRGLGQIPASGLRLRPAFSTFDALSRFPVSLPAPAESGDCASGLVLLGRIKPTECPSFRTICTPDNPLGAPMVSSEGACAAYYRYARQNEA
jgi:hydrogenase expression/formation protein HypD